MSTTAMVMHARSKMKELEIELLRLAVLYLAAIERRKDEDHLAAESLAKAVRLATVINATLSEGAK